MGFPSNWMGVICACAHVCIWLWCAAWRIIAFPKQWNPNWHCWKVPLLKQTQWFYSYLYRNLPSPTNRMWVRGISLPSSPDTPPHFGFLLTGMWFLMELASHHRFIYSLEGGGTSWWTEWVVLVFHKQMCSYHEWQQPVWLKCLWPHHSLMNYFQ